MAKRRSDRAEENKATPEKAEPKRRAEPRPRQRRLFEGESIPEVADAMRALYDAQDNRLLWAGKEKELRGTLGHLFVKHKLGNASYRCDGLEAFVEVGEEKIRVRKVKDEQ